MVERNVLGSNLLRFLAAATAVMIDFSQRGPNTHYLFAPKRLRCDWSCIPESAQTLVDYSDLKRLGFQVPTLLQFYYSLAGC